MKRFCADGFEPMCFRMALRVILTESVHALWIAPFLGVNSLDHVPLKFFLTRSKIILVSAMIGGRTWIGEGPQRSVVR